MNYLEVATEIALEAGKILREEYERPPQIVYKGEADLVTQADKRSEKCIVERLTKYFPEHAIVAEEGSGHEAASEFRWYVDPLDGTTNFAHSYPCFCVSIALAQRDRVIAGAMYNPIYNELFTAARGEGAKLNGKPIHVSKVPTLSTSLLCTGFPAHKRKASPNIHYYWEFTLRSHGVRRDGSAALDLASVAAGRFEAFWEFGLESVGCGGGSGVGGRGRREDYGIERGAVCVGRVDDFGDEWIDSRRDAEGGAGDFGAGSGFAVATREVDLSRALRRHVLENSAA